MRKNYFSWALVLCFFTFLQSCGQQDNSPKTTGQQPAPFQVQQPAAPMPDAQQQVLPQGNNVPVPPRGKAPNGGETGFIGIFDVPEMLALCRLDSAPMKDIQQKFISSFALLEKDMNEVGAQLDGAQGIMYFNNDPMNFKFQCMLLVKEVPKKTPKHSKLVVLKAERMLIYNYYGPYEETYKAYKEIKDYLAARKILQNGPTREFYPTEQSFEKDKTKLLTRIMVPVEMNVIDSK